VYLAQYATVADELACIGKPFTSKSGFDSSYSAKLTHANV